MYRRLPLPLCLLALFLSAGFRSTPAAIGAPAENAEKKEQKPLVPDSGLLLTRIGEQTDGGRRGSSFARLGDPLRRRLVDGTLAEFSPQEGDTLEGQEGWQWKRVEFGENGTVSQRGLCLHVSIERDKDQVLILNASGQRETYFGGEPRGGNVYGRGYVHLPVRMNQGANRLFFRAGRGAFRIQLYEPPAPVFLYQGDMTLPDLVIGQAVDTWGGVVVINATGEPAAGLTLLANGGGLESVATPVPTIPPLTIRKVGFRIQGPAPVEGGPKEITLELLAAGGGLCHSAPMRLNAVPQGQLRKVTFISGIDGSVQYFSVRPATACGPSDPRPAIVLTCHGAGVGGHGQAAAYASKSWFHIVAATNRRPFGYDWEDFGRIDAMEVLGIAQQSLDHDPSRIYVTGHSMGGHGAWHLAVTYPDRFAAVGPSAGWLSRSSYVSRQRDRAAESPMDQLLDRCRMSGETVALAANLRQQGVYILHGGADDNVPAAQARTMADVLREIHHDWVYHEEPGKGHWWGNEFGDGGTACVDWPFMFDLFARHALPPTSAVRDVEFVTANPGVSSRSHWLAIEGQIHHLAVSKAHVHTWPGKRAFKGTTENVAVLQLDTAHLVAKEPITVELDGQTIADIPYPDEDGALYLRRESDQWRLIERPPLKHKGPHRYGGIKEELRHCFLFVYGTRGTAEENAWAYRKARYDAETFWYRGNGSVDIIEDAAFEKARYGDRTVVLYGNAQTNAAWPALLGDSPVQVRNSEIRVADRTLTGDDLSAIFVRPREDSDVASVIAVSGSGPAGMRSTYAIPLFAAFIRYPDCLITRADLAESGRPENVAVGFFGLDWSVESGEFAFAAEK